MLNKNNPIYHITKDVFGESLITILSTLIKSQSPLNKELFVFEEDVSFLKKIIDEKKLIRLSEEGIENFGFILDFILNLKDEKNNLETLIESNKSFISSIGSIDDNVLMQIFNRFDLNKIKNAEEIIQALFAHNKNNCCAFVIDNYPQIDLNKITFHTVKTEDENNTIVLYTKPIVESFNIDSVNELKVKYQTYLSKIDFFAPTKISVYKKSDFDSLNVDSLPLNDEKSIEILKTKCSPIHEEHTTIVNKIISNLNKSYTSYVEKRSRTRYDQKSMKALQAQSIDLFKFLQSNRINFSNETEQIKTAFNLSLIQLAKNFKDTVKFLLTKKDSFKDIDLSIKNVKQINLINALIKNANYKMVEKIVKVKKLNINDLIYKKTIHPTAAIINTVMGKHFKTIKKSDLAEMQLFTDKLLLETDWNHKDKYGNNIAAQFLWICANTDVNLEQIGKTIKLKVDDKKDRYSSRTYNHYKSFLSLYVKNGIDLTQKNNFGFAAQDLLFDYAIKQQSQEIFTTFFDGNAEYGIVGFKNYNDEEKNNFLINMAYRLSFLFDGKESKYDYAVYRKIDFLINKLSAIGFGNDLELTNSVMPKLVSNDNFVKFFKNIGKHENSKQVSDINILIDKFNLSRQLEMFEVKPEVKKVNKFKV